jgi:hypothetical protein
MNEATEQPRYPRRPGFTGAAPEKDNRLATGEDVNSSRSAPVNTERPLPVNNRKMVERKAPELYTFKAQGDVLDGELIAAEKVEITDKQTQRRKLVMQYTIVRGDGSAVKCLGSYDLNTKLRPSDVGKWVEIIFLDVDASKNNMHVFKVFIEDKSADSARFADGTQITDEAIPF